MSLALPGPLPKKNTELNRFNVAKKSGRIVVEGNTSKEKETDSQIG